MAKCNAKIGSIPVGSDARSFMLGIYCTKEAGHDKEVEQVGSHATQYQDIVATPLQAHEYRYGNIIIHAVSVNLLSQSSKGGRPGAGPRPPK